MELTNTFVHFNQYLRANGRSESTIEDYNKDLMLVKSFLSRELKREPTINDLTKDKIEKFLKYSQFERNNKPATCQRQYYTISSLCSFAHKTQLVNRNEAISVERIRVNKEEPKMITEEEVRVLEQAIDHPIVRCVVFFLFSTGLRISECLSLTVEDLNFETQEVQVLHGKGGKQRTVPLSPTVVERMKEYLNTIRPMTDSDRLFATQKTGALSDVYVNRCLAKAVLELGWKKKVTCHVLRHSFASHLVKKGVHHVYIQQLLGHESLASTGIYTHVEEMDIKDQLQKLG